MTTLHEIFAVSRDGALVHQCCRVAPELVAQPGWLRHYAESYFAWLEQLPGTSVQRAASGARAITLSGTQVTLLGFAAPYIATAHGGREIRYAIRGGALAAEPGGWLSLGCRVTEASAMIWTDISAYQPRLGVGLLYRATQSQAHRFVTGAFLLRWAAAGKGFLATQRATPGDP